MKSSKTSVASRVCAIISGSLFVLFTVMAEYLFFKNVMHLCTGYPEYQGGMVFTGIGAEEMPYIISMAVFLITAAIAVIGIFTNNRYIKLLGTLLIAVSITLWLTQDIRFSVFVYFLRFFEDTPVIVYSKMVDYIKPILALPVVIAESTALAFKIGDIIKFKKSK